MSYQIISRHIHQEKFQTSYICKKWIRVSRRDAYNGKGSHANNKDCDGGASKKTKKAYNHWSTKGCQRNKYCISG